jgi:ATP-dependent exoDNAse (exonuclease V) beta subunit
VFIVGLEDGLLPLHWGEPDDIATAEERRLFYVGMTRAKDRLILSRARQRLWRGRPHALEPSPFLRDIENELVKHQPMQGARQTRRPAVEAVLKRQPGQGHEHDAGATSAHSRPVPPRVDSTRTQAPVGSRLCSLV